jgi:hypothetical protein
MGFLYEFLQPKVWGPSDFVGTKNYCNWRRRRVIRQNVLKNYFFPVVVMMYWTKSAKKHCDFLLLSQFETHILIILHSKGAFYCTLYCGIISRPQKCNRKKTSLKELVADSLCFRNLIF